MLPWVPEVFLACGGNFRAGHYKDLTETGNRARKVSGTQGTQMYTVWLFPDETIDHRISGCLELAKTQYIHRHNKAAAHMRWKIYKELSDIVLKNKKNKT